MGKSQNKIISRGIKKSLNRFLSIFAIVALGSGFLAGISAATPDMQSSADSYFDGLNMYDINIKGTMGITEDDVKALSKESIVSNVIGAYLNDIIMENELGESFVTRVYGLNLNNLEEKNFINKFELVSGRLPENENECVLEIPNGYSLKNEDVKQYKISSQNEDYENISDTYNVTKFNVVGIVKSPLFISAQNEKSQVGNGEISLVMYTYKEAFSLEVYTDLLIQLRGAKNLNTFSDDYFALVEKCTDKLESIGEERCVVRYNEVVAEANEKINDARTEYTNAANTTYNSLASAYKKLKNGQISINQAKSQLSQTKSDLDAAKLGLDTWNSTNDQTKTDLDQLEALLVSMQAEVDALKVRQNNGETLTQDEIDKISFYDTKSQELLYGRDALNQSISDYNVQNQAYLDGLSAYNIYSNKILQEEKILNEGFSSYYTEERNAKNKLAQALTEIDEAQKEVDEIEVPTWYVFDREDNVGFKGYKGDVAKVAAVAKVFPVFFFLIAMLISLTTMTRMVEEEREQIGIMKALGYSRRKILRYYIIYSLLASVLGSLVGLFIGFKFFPTVINNAYKMMYVVPKVEAPFIFSIALIVMQVMVISIMLATYLSVRNELREKPAYLLIPKAPKAGKRILLERISFIWNRLSFTHKVTARNLFRYKKRFLMTVIGIAGCTALLLAGFGLRDSIGDILGKQFEEIYKYNLMVMIDDEEALSSDKILTQFYNDKDIIESYGLFHSESGSVADSKGTEDATIYIGKDNLVVKKFFNLRVRQSNKDIPFDEKSVVLTEKLAESLGVKVGGTIELTNEDEEKATFAVTGICENYVTSFVYISRELYEENFDRKLEFLNILAQTTDTDNLDVDGLSTKLLSSDNVTYCLFTNSVEENFSNSLKSIDYIIIILIISAGALAMIVLYNLTNVNICERKKELATIKVLGFYDKEVSSYVFRETNILSFIGAFIGLGIGVIFHRFIIKTIEVDAVMFGRDIYWQSYVYALVLTLLFTLIVNFIMSKKLQKIDMVESMKAND